MVIERHWHLGDTLLLTVCFNRTLLSIQHKLSMLAGATFTVILIAYIPTKVPQQ